MKKTSITETILYLITGLLPLIAYYLLMTEYFKISPFEGYYLILTIYLIVCYVLYPVAGRKLSESTANKKSADFIPGKTQLLFAYIFAPFILILKKDK